MNPERMIPKPSDVEVRPKASSGPRSRLVRGLSAFLGIGILVSGGVAVVHLVTRPDVGSLHRQAESALLAGEYRKAIQLCEQALQLVPEDEKAALLAGEAHKRLGNYEQALQYFEQVLDKESKGYLKARFKAGRLLMHHLGRPSEAERAFREVLQFDPQHTESLTELATLLGLLARQQEAVPLILRLFQQNSVTIDLLTLLGSPNGRLENPRLFELCREQSPDDPNVLLARAWDAWNSPRSVDLDQAHKILERALINHPDFPPLRQMLVEVLWKQGNFTAATEHLKLCFEQGPVPARLWMIRGQSAEKESQHRSAARCYWEAYRLAPADSEAAFHLAEAASELGEESIAEQLRSRLKDLQAVKQASDFLLSSEHNSTNPLQRMVTGLEKVGRLWEAWAWCQIAARIAPAENWHRTHAAALRAELQQCPETQICPHRLKIAVDFSQEPLPDWKAAPTRPATWEEGSIPKISFRDDAVEAGLRFQYFNSPHAEGQGQRMFEFPGGGCGVLDFDGDGWPDLYLTQGCVWPVRDSSTEHSDRLFRNLGNGQFADVSEQAEIAENQFSAGIAAGDFDNDGFPDVYITNLGKNRFYRNNGDGTFQDITLTSDTGDPAWSSSCVMADLNGDSLPDIYSVNYLRGEDVFDRICYHQDGKPRMCMPFHFDGAQDQLFLNLGDGRFQNVTTTAGIQQPDGKGLGVVAADFTGDNKLDVFVANDTVTNFLFINQTDTSGDPPKFLEEGLGRGVALNGSGKAEGCMGIAVDDADSDGRLDLFITNFHQETNTLYLQVQPGLFEDRTQDAGLANSSLSMLGFGTQFLDTKLDGAADLIATNGHIDDLSPYGRPYRMRSQFYLNRGGARFREVSPAALGRFFEEKALGRGLAKCDWNRDGKEDVVISFLERPAALLTNTTEDVGHFLSLNFRGTKSARDAIGLRVRLTCGDQVITRHLVADGGYQASNQKRLTVGLGPIRIVNELEILWPSGARDIFWDIEANQELLFLESRAKSFQLAK